MTFLPVPLADGPFDTQQDKTPHSVTFAVVPVKDCSLQPHGRLRGCLMRLNCPLPPDP